MVGAVLQPCTYGTLTLKHGTARSLGHSNLVSQVLLRWAELLAHAKANHIEWPYATEDVDTSFEVTCSLFLLLSFNIFITLFQCHCTTLLTSL